MDTSSPQAYVASGGTLTNGQIPTQTAPTGTSSTSPTLVPSAISVDGLNTAPPTPPTLPTSPSSPNYSSITASAMPYTTASTDLLGSIKSLMNQDTGKAQYTKEQLDASGATALQNRQTELTGKISALNDQAQAIPLQTQKNFTGTGATVGGVAPITNAQLRDNAIQALSYKTEFDMNSGDLVNAQKTAQQAIDLKYQPIEQQIAQQQQLLQLYTPFMNEEQKTKADAITTANQQKQADLATQKDHSNTIMAFAADAIKNGAPTTISNRIMALATSGNPDINAAFALYSPYATNPQATQKAILDNQKLQADIKNEASVTTKNYADAAKATTDNSTAAKTTAVTTAIDSRVQPGIKDSDGTPFLDANGYFTAEGFKRLVQAAGENGMNRQAFLKQYGSLIDKGKNTQKNYGITSAEYKQL